MANEKRLIDANKLHFSPRFAWATPDREKMIPVLAVDKEWIDKAPTVDAVEVSVIEAYLQKKLDEWNALGDRKYEPANMWGYNFIMACFDDLETYK